MGERGWRRVMVLFGVVASGIACGGAGCPDRTASALSTRSRTGVPALFAMPERPRCALITDSAVDVGVVDAPALREVSGLAASLQDDGLVWAVADSDGVVFALDAGSGAVRAQIRLPGTLVDPEDLAVGPCPDLSGPCVFVADTGDNDRDRESVSVIAFPEPTLGSPATGVMDVTLDAVWTMRFVYPGGEGVDVEALAVLPDASAMLFFEKTKAPEARIFIAPAPWTLQTPDDRDDANDRPVTLVAGGAVALPIASDDGGANDDDSDGADAAKGRRITGASLHWSGTRLLLRTTTTLLEYERPAFDSAVQGGRGVGGLLGGGFGDLRGQIPVRQLTAPAGEARGEAVTFTHDGRGVFSISEVKKQAANDGQRPVLRRFDCAG